ncbi:MAG: type VI secretion system tip protein VgrG [Alphaproteobacteria bacterium]|nr:MAG: type VI secretion system tip protein VgrG [Alphaproteobacteria bacterium]
MPFTQDNRVIKIQIENLGPNDLLLTAVTGQEAISRPFSYRVEMLCEDLTKEIKAADMIGASATIGVKLKKDSDEYRFRSGFIRSFQTGNVHRDFRVFRAEIVPFLTFLQLSTDFRIFQNLTVVDILQQVFDDFGLNDLDMRVKSSDFPKLEYCVQCRETAFDFVSRLMEENGIFYFFEHSEASHTLVIADKLSDYKTCEQSNVGLSRESEDGRISIFEHGFDFRTGKWVIGDFSYGTPTKPPFDEENTRSEIPKPNPHRRYTFPQHFRVSEDARRFVVDRMQDDEAEVHAVSGNGEFVTFAPGFMFKVTNTKNIPYEEELRSYVITSLTWTAFEKGYRHSFLDVLLGSFSSLWSTDSAKNLGLGAASDAFKNSSASLVPSVPALVGNQFMGIPADTLFRPPRTTVKPEIRGPHTAVVVGVNGLETPGGNDICTDQYGRVRVKFPWDRSTDHDKDGQTSAWIRVAENWAGTEWGFQFPPRVGHEVVVQFVDGDPDRPLITGRIYNGTFRQPFVPPPLPPPGPLQPQNSHVQTTQRLSGIKTQSTPKPDGGHVRFHLLRFDDTYRTEQIVLRCQHRLDVTAFQNAYHTTHGNRHILVGGRDPDTGESGGALYITTGGEYDLHIGENRYEQVEQGYQLTVKANTIFDLQGSHQTVVGLASTLNAMNVVIEAQTNITLKVGASFVVVDPSGVYINGPIVMINSGGAPGVTTPVVVTEPVDASQADPGDPPNWVAQHRAAGGTGGGGHRHHTANPRHAIGTGLGGGVDQLVSMSPTLSRNIATLQSQGWTISYVPSHGYYSDRTAKTIVIDTNDPASAARELSHETGHGMYTPDPYVPPDGLTRQQYIDQNVARSLRDEGEATMTNSDVRREISNNGGPDIGIAGAQPNTYQQIADRHPDPADRNQARTEIGNAYADGEHPSTTPGQTYRQYYSQPYADYWDNHVAPHHP